MFAKGGKCLRNPVFSPGCLHAAVVLDMEEVACMRSNQGDTVPD